VFVPDNHIHTDWTVSPGVGINRQLAGSSVLHGQSRFSSTSPASLLNNLGANSSVTIQVGLLTFYSPWPCWQHFLFFVTWTKWARVFQHLRAEWLVRDKHSSLLWQFLTCDENEVLWIRPLVGKIIPPGISGELLSWVYHATTTTIDPKIGRDQGGLGCFGSSQEMKVRPLISKHV